MHGNKIVNQHNLHFLSFISLSEVCPQDQVKTGNSTSIIENIETEYNID